MWDKYKDTISLIFWILVIGGGCVYLIKWDKHTEDTDDVEDYHYTHIREFKGVDTVYSRDSAYVIHFAIDTVYYDPVENDSDYYKEEPADR